MPAPFSAPHTPPAYPALYLYPLNDSFIPKHISLVNNQRVKIGRQTNAKTVPAERNGYFDSKVLSRQHAEVWEETGKIFIKDVKSSNGTFINGERLSPEGLESEPFELKTDDIVEFGIDIVGEDNRTIIHHKVAARVVCVMTEQDAQTAARTEAQTNPPSYGTVTGQSPSSSSAAFNFNGPQAGGAGLNGVGPRRPGSQPQGLVGMGGMGGNVRAPGKSGLTFDHILSRLQGELQKSRDTGAELHSLTGAMNEIHDTLGGNLPSNLPSYPQPLPPVMPTQAAEQQQQQQQQQAAAADSASQLGELQAQLRETQLSLASHVDKIRSLEGMLAEHDAIKREVGAMRDMMEERMREMELVRRHAGSPLHRPPHDHDGHDSDDDDARSVDTVIAHELERVDEEDEEQLAAEQEEEERRRRRDELRPRTPEPTGMGMDDEEPEVLALAPAHPAPAPPSATPDDLTERLNMLSRQLESALELSRSLEAQHTTAQSTISALEAKVSALEGLVQTTRAQVEVQAEKTTQLAAEAAARALGPGEDARESLTEMINEWKKNVEGQWSGVREEWDEERERLRRAREEWEARARAVEDGLGGAVTRVESGLAKLAAQQHAPNGSAAVNGSGGLFTPPSPRSLSAESTRPRKKKRASSSRGRTRSRSASPGPSERRCGSDASSAAGDALGQDAPAYAGAGRRASWDSDSETRVSVAEGGKGELRGGGKSEPVTPASSVASGPLTKAGVAEARKDLPPFTNSSMAVAVLVLGVATAAVLWRVKPEATV